MSDVAVVLGLGLGQATFTVTPTGGDTATIPGARRWLLGPPVNGAPGMCGHFELQLQSTDAGQTANTYRWIRDQAYNASAPTAYTYFGNGFVPLGGI